MNKFIYTILLFIITNTFLYSQVELYDKNDTIFYKNNDLVIDTLNEYFEISFYYNNKLYIIEDGKNLFFVKGLINERKLNRWLFVYEIYVGNNNQIDKKYCFEIKLYECIALNCIDSFNVRFSNKGFEWEIIKEGNIYDGIIPKDKLYNYFEFGNDIIFPKEACCKRKYLRKAKHVKHLM